MKEKTGFLGNLKFDVASGLVVFFVALPLCIGISLVSTGDAAVYPGLIAGIVGGIVVGAFSGSRYGVSGPAAGLITIVAAQITMFGGFDNGGFAIFALAVVLAGVFQLILGFIKAGFLAYYFPFSVIKGMLAGIGITVFIKEIPHFLGYDKDAEGDFAFHQIDGHNTFEDLALAMENLHLGAFIVASIGLIILIVWGLKFIQNNKILSLIPGPVLAIVIGSLVAALFFTGTSLEVTGSHLVSVPTPESFTELKNQLIFPNFAALSDPRVYSAALTIAAVASIETLLCVEATDKMDPDKGRTPMNRELKAQGIGNIFSGLLGGLPITQVIIRSTANMQAGAKSKSSAIIHGFFLLIFVLAIPGILNLIPRSALAAVLVLIGYKLASPKTMRDMIKAGWGQAIPFFTVIVVMLFTDLLIGVGAGLVVGFIILLIKNYRISYFIRNGKADESGDTQERKSNKKKIMKGFHDEDHGDEKVVLKLSQHANFLNKANIMRTLDQIKDGKHVVLDFSATIDMDYDVREAISDFIEGAEDRDISVELIDGEKLKKTQ